MLRRIKFASETDRNMVANTGWRRESTAKVAQNGDRRRGAHKKG